MQAYELINAETLEIVMDGLTRSEALEIMEQYPDEFLLSNPEFDNIFI